MGDIRSRCLRLADDSVDEARAVRPMNPAGKVARESHGSRAWSGPDAACVRAELSAVHFGSTGAEAPETPSASGFDPRKKRMVSRQKRQEDRNTTLWRSPCHRGV